MANKKTIKSRVINAFLKGETLNKKDLRRKLRIPRTELGDYWFDASYMRTVRKLQEDGYLSRVYRGTYTAINHKKLLKLYTK
jgi:hypothetical protein